MQLNIENIRSFYGKHEIPIKKITLLVGENSSGKTTMLSCLAAATNRETYTAAPNLDKEPFRFGAFKDVISKCEGKGVPRSFSFGLTMESDDRHISISFRTSERGVPELETFLFGNRAITLSLIVDKTAKGDARLLQKGQEILLVVPAGFLNTSSTIPVWVHPMVASLQRQIKADVDSLGESNEDAPNYFTEFYLSGFFKNETLAFAAVRTKPLPTYEASQGNFQPDGSHTPFVLATVLSDLTKEENIAFVEKLNAFGRASGLFHDIRAKHLGDEAAAPFHLEVEVNEKGTYSKLPYVGYGVSQALPLVVEALRSEPGTRLLAQQPEVHLHPRAQAALASLFVKMAATEDKTFVLETHSDHIIDRVRREVREENINPEDVQILYFENKKGVTKIHTITIDPAGNIIGAPPGYRDFFLQEDVALYS